MSHPTRSEKPADGRRIDPISRGRHRRGLADERCETDLAFRFPDSLKWMCNHPVTPSVTSLGFRRLRTEALFEAAPTAASHFSSKTSSRVDAERFQTVAGEREYAPESAGLRMSPPREEALQCRTTWSSRSSRREGPILGCPPTPAWEAPPGQSPIGSRADGGRVSTLSPPSGGGDKQLLVVSSTPSDLRFCSPNGIRTRVFTLRGR